MVPRNTNDKITPFSSSLRYYHQPAVLHVDDGVKGAGGNLSVSQALRRWVRPILIIVGFAIAAAIASSVFVAFN